MFRLVHHNSIPMSFIVDPSAEFLSGMVAQLTVLGNQIVATVSNGSAPIGIIDDNRSKAFTNVSWNEILIVPAPGVLGPNNTIITPIDVKAELRKANVLRNSFSSTVDVVLNEVNGVVTFIAGTQLNFDLTGQGVPDAIRAVVNYSYYVPNIPGDDTTDGSGRITIWYDKMIFQTDQFETNQQYPLNANLYVSETGYLTSRSRGANYPSVGIVTAPPSALNALLEVMYF